MMAKTILVVDDERKIVTVLKGYLEQAGFRVVTAGDGQIALTTFRHAKPDLVILDLMLPGIDGLDVCRILRRESTVPIIMLTARAEEADRLIGLELGADDYVVKPFSPREVVLRVRAILRRVEGEVAASELLQAGDIALDLAAHQATVAGRPVEHLRARATAPEDPGKPLGRLRAYDRCPRSEPTGQDRVRPQEPALHPHGLRDWL
jgi:DNA-binding response OmpR family regulator